MKTIKVLEVFDGLKIQVFNDGTIKTLDHKNFRNNGRLDNRKGKILKPKLDKYGYKTIVLSKNGKRHNYTIHRLVAKAFIPNPNNLPQVNHKDGDKLNNNIENLEWCTCKENQKHKWKNGLANYKRNKKGQFTNEENEKIC